MQDETVSVRAMAIQAIRYTLPDSDDTFDAVLRTVLIDMLTTMMHDPELENRRLALTTLNSASHNKPDLILPHLNQLVPLVMKESIIKPELVREVMMGPFKHKVDDGLEVRKASSHLSNTCISTNFNRVHTKLSTPSWRLPSPVSTPLTSTIVLSPGSATNTIFEPCVTSCSQSWLFWTPMKLPVVWTQLLIVSEKFFLSS